MGKTKNLWRVASMQYINFGPISNNMAVLEGCRELVGFAHFMLKMK
jgi:hypothetical protein